MKPTQETRETAVLTFIWGAIFALGLFASFWAIIALLEWSLIHFIVFSAVATFFLTPSLLILWKVMRGEFAALIEEARE